MICLSLLLALFASLGGDEGPPARAPAADAPPLTVFMHTAKAGGLRYSWVLP